MVSQCSLQHVEVLESRSGVTVFSATRCWESRSGVNILCDTGIVWKAVVVSQCFLQHVNCWESGSGVTVFSATRELLGKP